MTCDLHLGTLFSQANALVAKFDNDADGSISQQEFITLICFNIESQGLDVSEMLDLTSADQENSTSETSMVAKLGSVISRKSLGHNQTTHHVQDFASVIAATHQPTSTTEVHDFS